MNMTLFAHSKEFRNKAGVFVVCCLSLVLFSFGVGRAVFSLLTLPADRPVDHVRYPISTSGSRNGAAVTAPGQRDLFGNGQADDAPGQGTALDYVRYADSLGTVLSPLQVIKTMRLRDPFSAPEGLEIPASTPTTSVASERPRNDAGRSTPAGAAESETPKPRELVSFAREFAESGSLAPAGLSVSLELLSGRRWTQSLALPSGTALLLDHRRAPDSIAPSTQPSDAALDTSGGPWLSPTAGGSQVFDRLAEGPDMVSRTDTSTVVPASSRALYSETRIARDSVVVFPWLKSATQNPIRRFDVAGVAPAVQTDRVVSAAVSQLSPTGVAPVMAKAEAAARSTRPPTEVSIARYELARSDRDSAPIGSVDRSTRAVAGVIPDVGSETHQVDPYLVLSTRLPAGAVVSSINDAASSGELGSPYVPAPVTPVIWWLDVTELPITVGDNSAQDVAHKRPIGMVANSLTAALGATEADTDALGIELQQSGEHQPWWMAFSAVPRSDLAVRAPVATPERGFPATEAGSLASGLVPATRPADSPMAMDRESTHTQGLQEPLVTTLPRSRVVAQQEAVSGASEVLTGSDTNDATELVRTEDATGAASITLTDRLIPGLIASTVQKPMAPTIADSPHQLTDDDAVIPELTPIVWPSIIVTGVVVTDDGRARATIHVDGQRKVIEPGQSLGELHVLSIGNGYLELGMGDDIRRYRIGDGGVE